jgi:hypothetical protein
MAEVFHQLSFSLLEVGNPGEAGAFRSAETERIRKIYVQEQNYFKAVLYTLWKLSADYGESLARWALSCVIVVFVFSLLYYFSNSIKPTTNGLDYIYFSVVTFTTLGYGDILPDGPLGKSLACVEVALGFSMFGLFLSFLGNRFQR